MATEHTQATRRADGTCRECGGPVPPTNLNLFFCSENCRRKGWTKAHPEDPNPDWDGILSGMRAQGWVP